MSDVRAKPGVAFWFAVTVVVALAAYPLSFGPVSWMVDRNLSADKSDVRVYRPLAWFAARCGHAAVRALWKYAEFGAPPTPNGWSAGGRLLEDEEYFYEHPDARRN